MSETPAVQLEFRAASEADVPAIVALLADDMLGAGRENSQNLEAYVSAFRDIAADSNQLLCIVQLADQIVGTMQLTVIPGLSRQGARRGLIEGVRVSGAHRNHGIGEAMIDWAVAYFRERECVLVQLTTDRQREAAHRFYERLGFSASHLGFKLEL